MAKAKTTKKATAKKTAKKSPKKAATKKTAKKTTKKAASKTKPKAKTTSAKSAKSKEVPVDRRASKEERRNEEDRRQDTVAVDEDRRTNPERRAKVSRRRQIDPTTCERDYNNDEIEFMHALDAYKRAAGRMFPTCSEILEVIRDLGYRRLTPEELAILQPVDSTAEGDVEGAVGEVGEDGDSEAAVPTDSIGLTQPAIAAAAVGGSSFGFSALGSAAVNEDTLDESDVDDMSLTDDESLVEVSAFADFEG